MQKIFFLVLIKFATLANGQQLAEPPAMNWNSQPNMWASPGSSIAQTYGTPAQTYSNQNQTYGKQQQQQTYTQGQVYSSQTQTYNTPSQTNNSQSQQNNLNAPRIPEYEGKRPAQKTDANPYRLPIRKNNPTPEYTKGADGVTYYHPSVPPTPTIPPPTQIQKITCKVLAPFVARELANNIPIGWGYKILKKQIRKNAANELTEYLIVEICPQ
jgi:hypothetical protein